MAGDKPIRHALDCITDADSAAVCFGAISRAGGRYACLEECMPEWRVRRVVRVKEVMGYEILGDRVDLGPSSTYSREASPMCVEIGRVWVGEMQSLLDRGLVKPHPIREVQGKWDGIINGLVMLQRGEVRGEKLVVRISPTS